VGFWVFGGGAFTGISATDEIPHAPELSYYLGDPVGGIIAQKTLRLVPLRVAGLL